MRGENRVSLPRQFWITEVSPPPPLKIVRTVACKKIWITGRKISDAGQGGTSKKWVNFVSKKNRQNPDAGQRGTSKSSFVSKNRKFHWPPNNLDGGANILFRPPKFSINLISPLPPMLNTNLCPALCNNILKALSGYTRPYATLLGHTLITKSSRWAYAVWSRMPSTTSLVSINVLNWLVLHGYLP